MRIALLGGSFDPVHNGHLRIAKTALRKLAIDEVWFLPCKDAPLKNGQHVSFKDRCNMVSLAISAYRKMKLCTIEGELEGTSYTIRTIQELQKRYPNDQFSFLIGDDQAAQFDKWKDSETLLKIANFYIFSRFENPVVHPGMQSIQMDLINVSSTDIRQGKKRYLLDKMVKRYIGEHYLYLEECVKQCMGEKRYRHSQSVASLCVALAKAHHLNEKKAYAMGITHDICKQMDVEKATIWMRHYLPSKMSEAYAIWHGYIGADYVKRYLYIHDKDVISAIYHHVLGDKTTPYDSILFVADKLDPSRGYDSSEQIALCKKDLNRGFLRVKQEQEAYLRKEGVV